MQNIAEKLLFPEFSALYSLVLRRNPIVSYKSNIWYSLVINLLLKPLVLVPGYQWMSNVVGISLSLLNGMMTFQHCGLVVGISLSLLNLLMKFQLFDLVVKNSEWTYTIWHQTMSVLINGVKNTTRCFFLHFTNEEWIFYILLNSNIVFDVFVIQFFSELIQCITCRVTCTLNFKRIRWWEHFSSEHWSPTTIWNLINSRKINAIIFFSGV